MGCGSREAPRPSRTVSTLLLAAIAFWLGLIVNFVENSKPAKIECSAMQEPRNLWCSSHLRSWSSL